MRDLVDELLRAKVETTLFGGDRAPRLGRLVLRDRLGAGATGTVFAARDPRLEREVAVKVLRTGDAARILAEARALAKLHHPNVVGVHDADELDGLVYIVMELAPGEPLRAWRPASWRDVVRVMREVAVGIAAAHAAGLVHRDIKPDNILVGPDRARVVDFGLARSGRGEGGARAGTPDYMAPELLAGGAATRASDQYAFGVTLREKLAAFADVPAWLAAIAARTCASDPAARFASMDDVAAALGRDRRRSRVLIGVAAAALACGAAAGAVIVHARAGGGDPCGGGDARVANAWPSEARDGVARALGDAPWAAHTLAALDDAAQHWGAAYRHVCEARHAQSDALLDLRMRCLDRAMLRFRGLVEKLDRLDRTARAAAPQAIAELPPPDACETLSDAGELVQPSDPVARAAADFVDYMLAGVSADVELGRYAHARAIVERLEPQWRGKLPVAARAELLAVSAEIEARVGTPEAARTRLDEALLAASEARAPALEADIWAHRLRDELFAGDPAKVLEWATFARAAALRAGRRGAEIDGIVAEAKRDAGDLGGARELLERALATAEPMRPERRALLELNLASVELAAGHSSAAQPILERARERVRAAFGDEHPELALYDDKLAAVARARGRLRDALALHARSLALRARAFGDDDRAVATSLYHRAQTELEADQIAAARTDVERALAIRTRVFGEHSPRLGELYALAGDIALAAGDVAGARDAYTHAAIDPRVPLAARRVAAGEAIDASAIPPPGADELLSLDRAAALDARAQLLARAHADVSDLAAAARARLTPDLDPQLAASLAHVLLVANDAGADGAYHELTVRLSSEPSRTGDRVRARR